MLAKKNIRELLAQQMKKIHSEADERRSQLLVDAVASIRNGLGRAIEAMTSKSGSSQASGRIKNLISPSCQVSRKGKRSCSDS